MILFIMSLFWIYGLLYGPVLTRVQIAGWILDLVPLFIILISSLPPLFIRREQCTQLLGTVSRLLISSRC